MTVAEISASGSLSPFAPLTLEGAGGARVTVLPYGAHIVGWTPASVGDVAPDECLFVSARSEYRVGAAVRGGIPVIFPQFSDRVAGPGPSIRHGFARTRAWQVLRTGHATDGTAEAVLALVDAPDTRERWPHAFRAELVVRVGGAVLTVTLAVENTGDAAFAFTGALHTYLRVEDVTTAGVLGLEAVAARDTAAGGALLAPTGAPLTFGSEVDQLFLDAPGPVMLDEPVRGRAVLVDQTGFRDVVVWNPGPARAVALADLEPDGWRRFACVEAVAAEPVTVAAGTRWEGTQRLTRVVRR